MKSVRLKPHPNMVKLLYAYYALFAFPFVLIALLLALVPGGIVAAVATLPLFALVGLLYSYWVGRYYDSIEYAIEGDRIIARRGVWWKRESWVPLVKVNNVVVAQGPLERALGLASVGFHTAAVGMPRPEVMFNYLSYDDAVRVKNEVTRAISVATQREVPVETPEAELLREVRRIREILEKLVEKS